MIKVNVKGERRLYAAIDTLVRDVSDFRRHWRRHIDIRHRYQKQWLDSRGGGTWPKLTDLYLERKRHDPRAVFLEILQLTGHLYRSLIGRGSDAVVEEGPTSLTIGSSDPKARWHHEGRGRLPVRRVISISDEEQREHQAAMFESLADIARRAEFKVVA